MGLAPLTGNGAFASSWEKLRRANEHLAAFKKSVDGFLHDDANRPGVKRQYYPKSQHFLWKVVSLPAMPADWGLQIGDTINNFRGALDHLAWRLVKRGTDPEPASPNRVQYPICDKVTVFTREVNSRLPGVNSTLVDLIEAHQPYNGWKEGRQLRELSNGDKHRLIHVVFVVAGSTSMSVDLTTLRDFRPYMYQTFDVGQPLKIGTKLQRIRGNASGPNPQIEINRQTEPDVAFDDGARVIDVLDKIGTYVATVLTTVEANT